MYDLVTEKLFALDQAYRQLPQTEKTLYLTFDDGPDEEFTPQVLQVLRELEARATFFVVTKQAEAQEKMIEAILREGHRLGNHSVDHAYGVFFSDSVVLKKWVQRGEEAIEKLSGRPSVGFRPPNGVLTPHLLRALDELKRPLILWNCRFFDTLVPWSEKSALRALRNLHSGDIILLHDKQKAKRRPIFLQTLKKFILQGQAEGWRFEPLPENLPTHKK